MPEGLHNFVQNHIRPVFGAALPLCTFATGSMAIQAVAAPESSVMCAIWTASDGDIFGLPAPAAGTSARTVVKFLAKAAGVSLTAPAAAAAGPQPAAAALQNAFSEVKSTAPAASGKAASGKADSAAASGKASGAATGSGATAGEAAGVDTAAKRQLLVRRNRTKSASHAPPLPLVRLASKNAVGRAQCAFNFRGRTVTLLWILRSTCDAFPQC